MRVSGISWGRRLPKAGGGPMLRRRPALRAGRRQNISPIQKVFDCKWYKTQALLPDAQWLYRIPVFTKGLCILYGPATKRHQYSPAGKPSVR
jgi:hypothetical protein